MQLGELIKHDNG